MGGLGRDDVLHPTRHVPPHLQRRRIELHDKGGAPPAVGMWGGTVGPSRLPPSVGARSPQGLREEL